MFGAAVVELAGLLVVAGTEVVLAVTVVVFAALELEPEPDLEAELDVRGAVEDGEVVAADDAVVVALTAALNEEQRAKPTEAAMPMSAALQAVRRQGVTAV